MSEITVIGNSGLGELVPLKGQHAIFVGQNGSGKSFLAKRILAKTREYRDILIVDPKCEIGVKNAKILNNPDSVLKQWGGIMIYSPSPDFDNGEDYNFVFKIAYLKRNCLVFIDELYAVTAEPVKPDYLKALYTRGRSMGISVFGCTQRPSWLPMYTISECKRLYVFRLTLPDDRKKMSGMIGANIPILSGHNFMYSDEKMSEPAIFQYSE